MVPERILGYFFAENYVATLILRAIDGILTTGTIASRNVCLVLYTKPESK